MKLLAPLAITLACAACIASVASCEKAEPTARNGSSASAHERAAAPGEAKARSAAASRAPAVPIDPRAAKKVDMQALELQAADGWEGEYNSALDSWTFQKHTPAGDDANAPNRFYVDVFPHDAPRDVQTYAAKLKEDQTFLDFGYLFTEVDEIVTFEGGWLVVGTSKDMTDEDDPGEPSFVMLHSDLDVYCRGGTFVDAKWRDEAIAACRSI